VTGAVDVVVGAVGVFHSAERGDGFAGAKREVMLPLESLVVPKLSVVVPFALTVMVLGVGQPPVKRCRVVVHDVSVR
jgi:hypothetical protein